MLFLGAGASAGFGVPTMQQLTADCERLLLERGFPSEQLKTIQEALSEYNFTADLEGLLTVLQGLASPESAIRAAGPFAGYLANRLHGVALVNRDDTGRHMTALKEMLVEKCLGADIKKAISHYNKLFGALAEVQTIRFNPHLSGSFAPNFQFPGRVPRRIENIFTLNYDLIIERYFEHEVILDKLRTGFVASGGLPIMLWDLKRGYEWNRQDLVNLVKLHGSIDQFRTERGIEKLPAPPSKGYYTTKVLEQMMIFPVFEKYVTRGPYFDMYAMLRERLQQEPVCIMIGYSFRDEAVNNAFEDSIENNANLKIVYVGGERAEEYLSRVPKISKRTVSIKKKFGIDDVYPELTQFVADWVPH
jgi:hypothetical protein